MDATKIPTNVGSIGIFDSGYGGLTILEQVRKGLPRYDYLYLGDAHKPKNDQQKENATWKTGKKKK